MGVVKAALPMLPLHVTTLPSPNGNVKFPHYCLSDVIRRLLMFPGNFEQMVFEPRTGLVQSEVWHGDHFGSNPLFTYVHVQNPSSRTWFELGQRVRYNRKDGSLGVGRIVHVSREEFADGTRGELVCKITPYLRPSELTVEHQSVNNELIYDWSVRISVAVEDFAGSVSFATSRDHQDDSEFFCDMALLRSPKDEHITLTRLDTLPQHPVDTIHATMDDEAFRRAKQADPDLLSLTLFIIFFYG